MEDVDQKAAGHLARLKIELSKVVTCMMEAKQDGFDVNFNIGPTPDYQVNLGLTKAWASTPLQ